MSRRKKYIPYFQYLFSCRDQSSEKTEGAVQSNLLTVARLLSLESSVWLRMTVLWCSACDDKGMRAHKTFLREPLGQSPSSRLSWWHFTVIAVKIWLLGKPREKLPWLPWNRNAHEPPFFTGTLAFTMGFCVLFISVPLCFWHYKGWLCNISHF